MGAAEGINPKNIRTIDLVFVMTVTACGALFFLISSRAMSGAAQSAWFLPFTFATIYGALLSVFAVTVGIKKLLSPVIFISILPSVILMPVVSHIITVFSMYFVIMYGLLTMRHTLFNVLTINMRMIVRSGIFYVSFGIIVILTSQYYFVLQEDVNRIFDSEKYVGVVNVIADTVLERSSSKSVTVDKMTIDDFLQLLIQDVYMQKTVQEQDEVAQREGEGMIVRWAGSMGVVIEDVQNNIEMQAVESMKDGIAEKIGHDVHGSEPAAKILSEVIAVHIQNMVVKNSFLHEHQALFFAGLFFVMLLSLASIGKFIAVLLARIGFSVLKEMKLIRITTSQRDAEVIAL